MIAQTHGDDNIEPHGTDGCLRLDVVVPIASSISERSSGEILGCVAGVSKIKINHKIDHAKPIPPNRVRKRMHKY